MSEPLNPLVKIRGGGYPNDEATIQQLFAAYAFNPSQYPLVFNVPGTLTVASDVAPWIVFIQPYVLNQRSRMTIKTLPTVTNSVSIDILKSTDGGLTFATILNTNPSLGPSGSMSKIIPPADFINEALFNGFNAGDILRLDILTVGDTVAGADLMVTLNGFVQTS